MKKIALIVISAALFGCQNSPQKDYIASNLRAQATNAVCNSTQLKESVEYAMHSCPSYQHLSQKYGELPAEAFYKNSPLAVNKAYIETANLYKRENDGLTVAQLMECLERQSSDYAEARYHCRKPFEIKQRRKVD